MSAGLLDVAVVGLVLASTALGALVAYLAARLDLARSRARVRALEAQLKRAEAQLEVTESLLDINNKLLELARLTPGTTASQKGMAA